MDSTCNERTDITNNNIDNTTSKDKISDTLDYGESLVEVDNRVNIRDTDSENDNIRYEDNVVRRRKTDRKRASVRTKLWRKSMMERSVLPPPPPPPDPSQPVGVDNNTTLSENNRACPENISVPPKDNLVSVMTDKIVLSTKITPRDATRVSEDVETFSTNTITLLKATGISTIPENSAVSPDKLTVSPIHQQITSHLDNKQPPSIPNENKWMSRKRLSLMKRQSLPPPPVPPGSMC